MFTILIIILIFTYSRIILYKFSQRLPIEVTPQSTVRTWFTRIGYPKGYQGYLWGFTIGNPIKHGVGVVCEDRLPKLPIFDGVFYYHFFSIYLYIFLLLNNKNRVTLVTFSIFYRLFYGVRVVYRGYLFLVFIGNL